MNTTPPATAQWLAAGLRRVLAPNPSPMTFRGTNSYIVGEGRVAVIDPGPALPEHMDNLLRALAPGETVSHILVTHSHVDHSPLAAPLSRRTGAPVFAFGNSTQGRSAVMRVLAETGLAGGGEGVDGDFEPDVRLRDGESLCAEGWSIEAIHTPGHMGNHLCLRWGDAVFTGDHVMGWASSLVSPPDGDLSDFMASLDRLERLRARRFYPGHGAPVADPAARIRWLRAHRRSREAEILDALAAGPADSAALARRIYRDLAPALLPAARRNVFAHLVDLQARGRVAPEGRLAADAVFRSA